MEKNIEIKNRKCLRLLFSQTKNVIFYSLAIISNIIIAIFALIILKNFIDVVIVGNNYDKVSFYVVPFVILTICSVPLFCLKSYEKNLLIINVCKGLTKEAYQSLLYSSLNDTSDEEHRIAASNIVKNSEYIANEFIGNNVLAFLEMAIVDLALVISAFIFEPLFGLISFVFVIFYCFSVKGLEIISQKFSLKSHEKAQENQEAICFTYDKLKDVKISNGLENENENFDERIKHYSNSFIQSKILMTLSKIVLIIAYSGIVLASITGIGGLIVRSNPDKDLAGTFLIYTMLVPVLFYCCYVSIHYNLSTKMIQKQVKELELISSLRSELKSEPVNNLDDIHSIRFKDVICTSDLNCEVVLNKCSFELKRGEKLGVLCDSKETKDAIFNVITKITLPKEGEIQINNCDVSKINTIYLRNIITALYDNSTVLSETIIDNICYPEGFDDYKYNDALNRSGLKAFMAELPEKEQTKVLNDDAIPSDVFNRLVLANAFYRDSKIYLLNDATSKFSTSLENEFVSELFRLKNKIIILMSDKGYLLSKCDKILIIENSEIIEYGKSSELLNDKSSRFYKEIRKGGARKVKVS